MHEPAEGGGEGGEGGGGSDPENFSRNFGALKTTPETEEPTLRNVNGNKGLSQDGENFWALNDDQDNSLPR